MRRRRKMDKVRLCYSYASVMVMALLVGFALYRLAA
jgi:hypothetical protein